jgi:GNAT superfamily N-acetyltransferase
MASIPRVRIFGPDEWALYRELRLAALADSPDAFGSTFARESEFSDDEWANRLASAVDSGNDHPVVAEIDGRGVGLAWGRIDGSGPAVARLYQVWVHPDHRSHGAGRMLLDSVVEWAREHQASFLELSVTCGNTPARHLYATAGFEAFGLPQPIRSGAEALSQAMRLDLHSVEDGGLPEER